MLAAQKLNHNCESNQAKTSYKVRAPKKRNLRKEKMLVLGCVILAFITGLLLTTTHAKVTISGYKINQLKAEITALQNTNERLQLEIAALKSLSRIETIARKELAMVQPSNEFIQYIALENPAYVSQVIAMSGTVTDEDIPQIEVQSGNVMHPVLRALNHMVANYVFGVRTETSEL